MNILVADDEKVIREGITRTIRRLFPEHQVYAASSAGEAARIMEETPVQIVLTDIQMPGGMTGLELISAARPRHPAVKWVVLTAHGSPANEQEALQLGARFFLHKPIGKSMIEDVIHTLCAE